MKVQEDLEAREPSLKLHFRAVNLRLSIGAGEGDSNPRPQLQRSVERPAAAGAGRAIMNCEDATVRP
jgi:hypothetical protein